MGGDLATDLNVKALRDAGRWALFWEVIHARGSSGAVAEAWATITDEERPAAEAGLEAAREARQERLGERARLRAASRSGEPVDYVADAAAAAADLARRSFGNQG